jgi:ubiquinone/menaquinone biosynthesis C-methylase UbiE
MFKNTEEFYDLMYSAKDYRHEAQNLARLIHERIGPGRRTLLDVACGTGEHHRFLANEFEITGLDLNAAFIEIARRKNPGATYHVADMTDFSLGRKFDVITSLFSAIGYVQTLERVVATLKCFERHLAPGGVILLEAWMEPQQYRPGATHLKVFERDGVKVVRASVSLMRDGMSYMPMHYLIVEPTGVRHLTEEHVMGIFTVEQNLNAFREAGLVAEKMEQPLFAERGLYVGRRA